DEVTDGRCRRRDIRLARFGLVVAGGLGVEMACVVADGSLQGVVAERLAAGVAKARLLGSKLQDLRTVRTLELHGLHLFRPAKTATSPHRSTLRPAARFVRAPPRPGRPRRPRT